VTCDDPLAVDDRLLLPVDQHFEIVKVDTIEVILAAGDYSEVHLSCGEKLLVLRSLLEWQKRLPEKLFVRVHRSIILNLDSIDRLEEWFNGSFRIHLRNGRHPVVSSRRYSADLRARLR
jgi:two-component system, LytTR family, response regulator